MLKALQDSSLSHRMDIEISTLRLRATQILSQEVTEDPPITEVPAQAIKRALEGATHLKGFTKAQATRSRTLPTMKEITVTITTLRVTIATTILRTTGMANHQETEEVTMAEARAINPLLTTMAAEGATITHPRTTISEVTFDGRK